MSTYEHNWSNSRHKLKAFALNLSIDQEKQKGFLTGKTYRKRYRFKSATHLATTAGLMQIEVVLLAKRKIPLLYIQIQKQDPRN